ncbi:MAG TPA: transketolase [Rectinemataceae bacterium]|nr:transketolase [Rectinemataceae bacterium]
MDITALEKVALSVRSLSMDAVQAANSGHPGLPLGCAELGALLYGEVMRQDPADPSWLDRDRFVLSAGHGSMFLYSLLHLAGYGISLDEIRRFRQVGSPCAGHPEYGQAPGIETTTGPLGQGVANAVGMAIAESMLAARFNTPKRSIIDHRTWVLAGDGCLMEGVSGEASSLAGHLKLGKLIVFYDSNAITIDGSTSLAFSEDVAARYAAYGWKVLHGDMYDFAGLARLMEEAKSSEHADKPKLIILKSIIGKGSPNKQGTAAVHGSALGEEEVAKTKANLGIPAGERFWVAPEARSYFEERRKAFAAVHAAWNADFEAWKRENPSLAAELSDFLAGRPRKALDLPSFAVGEKVATRAASGKCLAAVAASWPNLVGGSADLTGPNVTQLPEGGVYGPGNPTGRMIHFGVREHAMAAIANGLSLHGGLRPFVATFLTFFDYLKPGLRLAALMKQPVIYILTHDSIYLGEDGPTHQPIEQLASIRAIPNVRLLRPADAAETAVAWRLAMERTDGPTVLALSRQNLAVFEKDDPEWPYTMGLGAYVVRNTSEEPEIVVAASGSEVSLALAALESLGGKAGCTNVRVLSVPSRELFFAQPEPVRKAMLGSSARVVVAEAGVAMGWERIAKPEDIMSIERFGESGPGEAVAEHLGYTSQKLAALISR